MAEEKTKEMKSEELKGDELIKAAQERNIPLEKYIAEEGKKLSWWNRRKFYREVKDSMAKEILACQRTLQCVPPNEKAYSIAMSNLKTWTDCYTAMFGSGDGHSKLLGVIITSAVSIIGTLLVCGHEDRGGLFVGKGLGTILKPKDRS